ncbi:hypothetical protein BDZ45DRAFT_689750 [Acephala macrosclerotiorum]|nr:hypothetical protein BDZ45DRAFT_689750 [Acephala macrosclerotiorum]
MPAITTPSSIAVAACAKKGVDDKKAPSDKPEKLRASAELRRQIFKYLGPAGQRLLGATSAQLYEIYRDAYYENIIKHRKVNCRNAIINFEHDLKKIEELGPLQFNDRYLEILSDWMPYNGCFPTTGLVGASGLGSTGFWYLSGLIDDMVERRKEKKSAKPLYVKYGKKVFLEF